MTKFIVLTDIDGKEIFINTSMIICYTEKKPPTGSSHVYTSVIYTPENTEPLYVAHSVNEITAKIAATYD